MKLNVVERNEDVVHVACEGKLAPLQSGLRVEPLVEVLGSANPAPAVVLDLSRTDYINSSGINWLIQAHKQLDKLGASFALHSLTPQVREAIDLVQLSSYFKVSPDRSAALANLGLTKPGL